MRTGIRIFLGESSCPAQTFDEVMLEIQAETTMQNEMDTEVVYGYTG